MFVKLLYSLSFLAFACTFFYNSYSPKKTHSLVNPEQAPMVEDYVLRPPGWPVPNKEHIDPVLDPLSNLASYCDVSSKPDPASLEGITWAYRCAIFWQQKTGGYFRVKNSQGNPVVYKRQSVVVYRSTRLEGDDWNSNITKIIHIFNTGMTAPFFRWGNTGAIPILDVWQHVKDFAPETGYLSTSLLKSACIWIINTYYGGNGILYQIRTTPHLGIDVNATLKNSNPINEHISEVVIPGYVHGYRIEKATVYKRGSERYSIINKNHNLHPEDRKKPANSAANKDG